MERLGLQQWEEARSHWLRHNLHHHYNNNNNNNNKSSDTDSTARAAVPIEVDDIIDILFSPRWREVTPVSNTGTMEDGGQQQQQQQQLQHPRSFPQPVPLPQMVDILVDLWEAEGLDT